jgi:hypothetical protein
VIVSSTRGGPQKQATSKPIPAPAESRGPRALPTPLEPCLRLFKARYSLIHTCTCLGLGGQGWVVQYPNTRGERAISGRGSRGGRFAGEEIRVPAKGDSDSRARGQVPVSPDRSTRSAYVTPRTVTVQGARSLTGACGARRGAQPRQPYATERATDSFLNDYA